MVIEETKLPGVLVFVPTRHRDERGYFMELWQEERYADLGLPAGFVQDNCSYSKKGVLRGMHFQNPTAQGKLISVLEGSIFDVAVDLRKEESTFGQWCGKELSSENGRQMWVPEGFAHGFVVTSPHALVHYKTTDFYNPHHDRGLNWKDPDIDIAWPIDDPILSEKDEEAPLLRELPEDVLF